MQRARQIIRCMHTNATFSCILPHCALGLKRNLLWDSFSHRAASRAAYSSSNGRHGSRAWQKKNLGISFHMKPAVGEEEYHWHSSSSAHWLNCNFEGCKMSFKFHVQSSRKCFVISCELCDDFCLADFIFRSYYLKLLPNSIYGPYSKPTLLWLCIQFNSLHWSAASNTHFMTDLYSLCRASISDFLYYM